MLKIFPVFPQWLQISVLYSDLDISYQKSLSSPQNPMKSEMSTKMNKNYSEYFLKILISLITLTNLLIKLSYKILEKQNDHISY